MKRLVIPLLTALAGLGFASARADLAALGAAESPALAFATSAVADPPSVWTARRMPAPADGSALRNGIAMTDDVALIGDMHKVHVYRKEAGQWVDKQVLVPNHPIGNGLYLGSAIALRGSRAVVSDSFSINGSAFAPPDPEHGEGSSAAAAAYVFEDSDGSWLETARLTPDDGAPGSWGSALSTFATAVAIDGTTIVVGAFGNTIDADRPGQGSVYVFTHDGSGWRQTQKLVADDARAGDDFGNAIALQGNTLLIGARNATRHRDVPSHGLVYVFEREGGVWTQRQRLFPPTLESDVPFREFGFGQALALEGDTAIVGAPGMGGPYGRGHGAIYVLQRSNGLWQAAQALPSLAHDGYLDGLGWQVALSGDRVLAGAYQSTFTDGRVQQGTVHVYERSGERWIRRGHLTSPEGRDYGFFGSWLALSGRSAIIGSFTSGDDVFAFEARRPPRADIGPAAIDLSLPTGRAGQRMLEIANSGDEPLRFDLLSAVPARGGPLQPQPAADVASRNDEQTASSPLSIGPRMDFRPADPPMPSGARLDFALDDGSFQLPMSFGHDYWEQSTIWLNRFSAPPGTGAFTLDSVSILFPPQTLGTLVGKSINLIAYYDAYCSGDPANAVRLGGDHFVTIGTEGQFDVFETDFRVPGDGDIYVGFETTYARNGSWPQLYPSALNVAAPVFAHSWMASMERGVANLDDLSANRVQGYIENLALGGGNWLIRATGSEPDNDCIAPADVPWLVPSPSAGSIPAGGSATITLAFDTAGLAEGTHAAQLCVASDDPARSMQRVPVVLTVLPDGTIFRDGFEGTP